MTEYEKILSTLQNLCVKKECCSSELLKKALRYSEGDAGQADRLLDALISERYVDDGRYAAAFAREKASLTGWGPAKISLALRMKGICKSDIDKALSEIDREKADEKLEKLVRVKSKALAGDQYIKFKLIKYALSRGYEYSAVEPVVCAVLAEQSE